MYTLGTLASPGPGGTWDTSCEQPRESGTWVSSFLVSRKQYNIKTILKWKKSIHHPLFEQSFHFLPFRPPHKQPYQVLLLPSDTKDITCCFFSPQTASLIIPCCHSFCHCHFIKITFSGNARSACAFQKSEETRTKKEENKYHCNPPCFHIREASGGSFRSIRQHQDAVHAWKWDPGKIGLHK